MTRINVYTEDEYDGKTLAGWFDPDAAERYDQDRVWDGNNWIGVITRSQWVDEYLYRTAGGRWVVNHDAHRCCNGPDTYRFVGDGEARDWLIRSLRNDEAIEKYFGTLLPEESGPGRPEIGHPINVRLGDELLAQVDAEAGRRGATRAETIRDLIASAIGARYTRTYEDGSRVVEIRVWPVGSRVLAVETTVDGVVVSATTTEHGTPAERDAALAQCGEAYVADGYQAG